MNLLQVTDTMNAAQTYSYGYDPDNRVTSANATGVSESYTIDPWGNLQASGNFSFAQQYATNNQISASGYAYDAAGELTTDGNGNTYTYDRNGMLTASNGAQYVYDALDQRIEKTVGGSSTISIYLGADGWRN